METFDTCPSQQKGSKTISLAIADFFKQIVPLLTVSGLKKTKKKQFQTFSNSYFSHLLQCVFLEDLWH